MYRNRLAPIALTATLLAPLTLGAQVPGTPALQNAFGNPGLAVAGNFGGGGGQSFYGAAAAYGMMGGRLQLSGGAGVQRANETTRGAYGARATAMVWGSEGGALGASAFVGVGGGARTRDEADVVTNPAIMSIPVGVTVGYRRPMGSRGISVYGSPIYRWTRVEDEAGSATDTQFSLAAGLDIGLTRSFGATVGAEFGGTNSTIWGLALSFVPGR